MVLNYDANNEYGAFINHFASIFEELYRNKFVTNESIGYFVDSKENALDDIMITFRAFNGELSQGRINQPVQIFIECKKPIFSNVQVILSDLCLRLNESLFTYENGSTQKQIACYCDTASPFSDFVSYGKYKYKAYSINASFYYGDVAFPIFDLTTDFNDTSFSIDVAHLQENIVIGIDKIYLNPSAIISLDVTQQLETEDYYEGILRQGKAIAKKRVISLEALVLDDDFTKAVLNQYAELKYRIYLQNYLSKDRNTNPIFANDIGLFGTFVRQSMSINLQKGKYMTYRVSFIDYKE